MALAVRASRLAAKPVNRVAAARTPMRVVCKATSHTEAAKKAVAFASTLPAMLAASPAFALVDERLNGDGTGLSFGVNDGALGWALVLTFGVMWAIWFNGQKDLGDFEDVDDGLSIK